MIQRYLLPLAAATVLHLTAAAPAAEYSFIRGDCNSDASLDISDPVRLLDELFASGAPVVCDDACDANDDGAKNLADAMQLLGAIFGEGPPPGAPFPLCGVDPTDDDLGCLGQGPGADCLPLPPAELALLAPPDPTDAFPGRVADVDRPGEGDNVPGHSVNLFSGEFDLRVVDLAIPGVGIDFSWARTYRSRSQGGGHIGHNWDHSYDIYLQEVFGGLLLHEGDGGATLLTPDANGVYCADGAFYSGEFDGDGNFIVTFGNHGEWRFLPLGDAPAAGKISAIVDRHGNMLQFQYQTFGHLIQIVDTLGRVITISYNALGDIGAVTDFAGRSVVYEYYDGAEMGGSLGDLKSVRSPIVTGTPTGNDYPDGKTTVYAYSVGFADECLNHNLLCITDPKGQMYLQNVYAMTGDPSDSSFDRVVRQIWGDPGDIVDLVYETTSGPTGQPLQKTIVNDRRGLVKEYLYDERNLLTQECHFTGFADADLPTTSVDNRPVNPLRATDPVGFVTTYSWNADALLGQVTHPNGNMAQLCYELDLDPMAPRHARGNLRMHRRIPGTHVPPGDQPELVELFEYEPGFGGWEAHEFLCRHIDAKGAETVHDYDELGNRISTTHAIPSVVEDFEYNATGQLIAHVHPSSAAPPALQRRRDEFSYHGSGPQAGYLSARVIDATGEALATLYSYDSVGNLVQVVDPNGGVTDYSVNPLNQICQVLSPTLPLPPPSGMTRYQHNFYYDANDNLAREDIQRIDENGEVSADECLTTLVEFDVLNHPIARCQEVGAFNVPLSPLQLDCGGLPSGEFVTTAFQYNANRFLAEIRYGQATNGQQVGNVQTLCYDERDLLYRSVRGFGAAVSTRQYNYDGNGNLVEELTGLEDNPRIGSWTVDGYDRTVMTLDPMGNETLQSWSPTSQVVHILRMGEISDQQGAMQNLRLAEEELLYDAMDRLCLQSIHHFDPVTQEPNGDGLVTTAYSWTDTSQLLSLTDDNGNVTQYSYDTVNRLGLITDALGNTTAHAYDANSNLLTLEETDLPTTAGLPPQCFITGYCYDSLNRQIGATDALGNTHMFGYDSRGNLTVETDALGNVTHHDHDGMNRLLQSEMILTSTGAGGGTVIGSVVTQQVWDDSSRLVARTDPNGNTTAYSWDALNRKVLTLFADGTQETYSWDVHDNLAARFDANGSQVFYEYDLLNRKVEVAVDPGPGVAADTTFEMYAYDGLSRLTHAQDNDSEVDFQHDSLGYKVAECWPQLGLIVTDTYDGVGNVLCRGYPGGRAVSYSYDGLNRIKEVLDEQSDLIGAYEYYGPGRVLWRHHGNDTRSSFDYDGARRITATMHVHEPLGSNTPVDVRSYSWNPQYHKTQRADTRPGGPGLKHDYVYDSLYRLIGASVVDATGAQVRDTAYQLDPAGNRILVDDDQCNGDYVMDPALPIPGDFQMNQYTMTGCDTRSHDENGNLTALITVVGIPPVTREFDYRDQLVASYDPIGDVLQEFEYDALGRRIGQRTFQAGAVIGECRGLWDGWQEVEDRDGAGTPLRTYVYGNRLDERIGFRALVGAGPADYYYHEDDLGNVMAVSAANGAVVERYEYSDYGMPSFFAADGTAMMGSGIGNEFLFSGRRYCAETGLYYFRSRHLDPGAGRFISRDPLGIWGDSHNTGNPYSYVGNNPWTLADPTGLADHLDGLPSLANLEDLAQEGLLSEDDAANRNFGRRVTGLSYGAGADLVPGDGSSNTRLQLFPQDTAWDDRRRYFLRILGDRRRGSGAGVDPGSLSRVRGGAGMGSVAHKESPVAGDGVAQKVSPEMSGKVFPKISAKLETNVRAAVFAKMPAPLDPGARGAIFVKMPAPLDSGARGAIFVKTPAPLFKKSSAPLFKKASASLFVKASATLFVKTPATLFKKNSAPLQP